MTVVTGGMNAEYGNAQAGVVSFVTREGGQAYHGMVDYAFTPAGQKHWGESVYDSNIHRGNNKWSDPSWVGETVTLADGSTVPAHRRLDYTGKMGHFIEGNLSGPMTQSLTFFVSSKWQKQPVTFPDAHLTTPFNTNTNLKMSYAASPTVKVLFGGFYDQREGTNTGLDVGGRLNLKDTGKNVFLQPGNPAGDFEDRDWLAWGGVTHSLSPKTFYELRLSVSSSGRDTTGLHTGGGLTNPETAVTGNPVKDAGGYYTVRRDVVNWDRFSRMRLGLKGDLSSQVNKQNFVKLGIEATRFNNWHQAYFSNGPSHRNAFWYGKTYSDTDFFPGQTNAGVNPIELGVYLQDKIEFEGMIVNAGVRADAFFVKEYVTDVDAFYGALSPMWMSMTRNRNVPTVEGGRIGAISPRVGVSHPITSKSLIRFFYGKFTQFPDFNMLYRNQWQSQAAVDRDLNGNGTIDPAERWNAFNDLPGTHHNPHLPPETTVNFELGVDWNFVADYVAGITTYYKSSGNGYVTASQQWIDPASPQFVQGQVGYAFGTFRDTRGFEISLKKQFSNYFSFNLGYNLQWADEGRNSAHRRDVWPDSQFVANGHYWRLHDVDPTTGAEIPVSLRDQEVREGLAPNTLVIRYGNLANTAIRNHDNTIEQRNSWAWIPWLSHHSAEGVIRFDHTLDKQHYDDADRAFWERINSAPNYPGSGEANLMVAHNQETGERAPIGRDRRAYGSMTFLFATPADFGPWSGQALGNIRANLVYRLYTGTRFTFAALSNVSAFQYGPMHDRMDMTAEKQIGSATGKTLTLAVEVVNLFNQKDYRQASFDGRLVDFVDARWQTYGITGLEPTSADYKTYGEIYDVNNYLDQPREMNFSLRLKW
jgi:hypothetical protein